jgi:hypothetical protein
LSVLFTAISAHFALVFILPFDISVLAQVVCQGGKRVRVRCSSSCFCPAKRTFLQGQIGKGKGSSAREESLLLGLLKIFGFDIREFNESPSLSSTFLFLSLLSFFKLLREFFDCIGKYGNFLFLPFTLGEWERRKQSGGRVGWEVDGMDG